MTRVACVVLVLMGLSPTLAQELRSNAPTEPKTKLEQFVATSGAVIVKSYSEIGSQSSPYGGKIGVNAMVFTNVATQASQKGITIEVEGAGKYDRKNISYIDYDEIVPLLDGLAYISTVTREDVPLYNFEATFASKGDFKLITFSSDEGTMLAVKSGSIGGAQVYYKFDGIEAIRDLLQRAKERLEGL